MAVSQCVSTVRIRAWSSRAFSSTVGGVLATAQAATRLTATRTPPKNGFLMVTPFSIVSKGDDGVDAGRAAGRVDAGDEADEQGETHGAQEDPQREGEVADEGNALPGEIDVDDPVDEQAR